MKNKAPSPSNKELLLELDKLLVKIEKNKKNYERLDEITLILKDHNFSKEKKFELIDNFSEKNVVFRPAGVRRFEVKRRKSSK